MRKTDILTQNDNQKFQYVLFSDNNYVVFRDKINNFLNSNKNRQALGGISVTVINCSPQYSQAFIRIKNNSILTKLKNKLHTLINKGEK